MAFVGVWRVRGFLGHLSGVDGLDLGTIRHAFDGFPLMQPCSIYIL